MTSIESCLIEFPLTEDQVRTFNVNQILAGCKPAQGLRAAMLCPEHESAGHVPVAGVVGLMVALRGKLVCPCCEYTQKTMSREMLDELPVTHGSLDDPEFSGLLELLRDADRQLSDLLNSERCYVGINVLQPNVSQYLKELCSRFRPKGPEVESVPLALLITLHNQAPADSPIRRTIIGFIKADNVRKPRQHWMGGLYLNAENDLCFDEALYERTVWRGKQETYFESVEDGYAKLQRGLSFLHSFQKAEDASTGLPAPLKPLLPVRDLQDQVAHLKRIQPRIEALVGAMEGRSFAELASNLRPEASVVIEAHAGLMGLEHE
ncbi:hypothetical protein [Pseudomonas sp. NPDC089569]|uniref:hypothetical protein n=1 Tax=Pseudomonas sp. NPDC089569 TaxID=3390722 RepID=UPI003D038171